MGMCCVNHSLANTARFPIRRFFIFFTVNPIPIQFNPSNSMSFSKNLVMASFNCKALSMHSDTLFSSCLCRCTEPQNHSIRWTCASFTFHLPFTVRWCTVKSILNRVPHNCSCQPLRLSRSKLRLPERHKDLVAVHAQSC